MKIQTLGKDLQLQPFRCKTDRSHKLLLFGGGREVHTISLHKDNPPPFKIITPGVIQLENVYAYFYARNFIVLAKDFSENNEDLLLYIKLNIKKHATKGEHVIKVGEHTKRMFYDHTVNNERYPDYFKLHALVYIKKNETALLTDWFNEKRTLIMVKNKGYDILINRVEEEE